MDISLIILLIKIIQTVMFGCAISVATATTSDRPKDCQVSITECTQLIELYIDDMSSLAYLQIYDTICPYVSHYRCLIC